MECCLMQLSVLVSAHVSQARVMRHSYPTICNKRIIDNSIPALIHRTANGNTHSIGSFNFVTKINLLDFAD